MIQSILSYCHYWLREISMHFNSFWNQNRDTRRHRSRPSSGSSTYFDAFAGSASQKDVLVVGVDAAVSSWYIVRCVTSDHLQAGSVAVRTYTATTTKPLVLWPQLSTSSGLLSPQPPFFSQRGNIAYWYCRTEGPAPILRGVWACNPMNKVVKHFDYNF